MTRSRGPSPFLARSARCGLTALLALLPSAVRAEPEAAPLPGDWGLVQEAKRRLDRADYAAALRLVQRIPPGSEAAGDAQLLREQIDEALAPHIDAETRYFGDTQPFHRLSQDAGVAFWPRPSLRARAVVQQLVLPDAAAETPRYATALALGSTWRPPRANLDLSAAGTLRRWADGAVALSGSADLEARWLLPLRLRAGARRDELMDTESAMREHVSLDAAHGVLAISDWHGFSAELRLEGREYSDGNSGRQLYGWAIAPLVRGRFSLHAGWGAAHADTAEPRWDLVTRTYTPYFTPLGVLRHGPVVATALVAGPVRLHASGDVSLQASELDPTALVWGEEARVKGFHADAKAGLSTRIGRLTLSAEYHYNHQLYYRFHHAFVRLEVPLG